MLSILLLTTDFLTQLPVVSTLKLSQTVFLPFVLEVVDILSMTIPKLLNLAILELLLVLHLVIPIPLDSPLLISVYLLEEKLAHLSQELFQH